MINENESNFSLFQAECETYYSLKTPTKCPNEMGCRGTNFTPMNTIDQGNYKDYQEIKIQVRNLNLPSHFEVYQYKNVLKI